MFHNLINELSTHTFSFADRLSVLVFIEAKFAETYALAYPLYDEASSIVLGVGFFLTPSIS